MKIQNWSQGNIQNFEFCAPYPIQVYIHLFKLQVDGLAAYVTDYPMQSDCEPGDLESNIIRLAGSIVGRVTRLEILF